MNEVKMCSKCGVNPAQELHICPYQSDINNNYELCDCCEECEYECAMDI